MKHQIQVLKSEQDLSVNFVFDNGLEARYVRRPGTDYAIVYLSSHRGCNQACRFCHLTQTKQVDMTPATMQEFRDQINAVFGHYDLQVVTGRETPVKKFHFNWMARGEPLLNDELVRDWKDFQEKTTHYCHEHFKTDVAFNFSSILPMGSISALEKLGESKYRAPTLFYSLYSLSPRFRRRWLPQGHDPKLAMALLGRYQEETSTDIVLHWSFIEGENDSKEEVQAICDLVRRSGVRARFNLVRYNPYSPVQGKESSEAVLQARFEQLEAVMLVPGSRIVPRVGPDVKASCGQFINLHQK